MYYIVRRTHKYDYLEKDIGVNGLLIKNSDTDETNYYTLSQINTLVQQGIIIGGLDNLQPLQYREANRKPFLYDYCRCNAEYMYLLSQIDDDTDAKHITIGTKQYVKWKCSNNHTWSARLDSRIYYNQGCPFCTKEVGVGTSFSEQRYFYYLKKFIPDLINRVVIDNLEFDMYSENLKLAIEYDGGYHTESALQRDIIKDKYCMSKNINFIRIRSKEAAIIPKVGNTEIYYEIQKSWVDIIKSILNNIGIDSNLLDVSDYQENTIYLQYKPYLFQTDKQYKTIKTNGLSVLQTSRNIIDRFYAFNLNNYDLTKITKGSELVAVWYCEICGEPYNRSFHQVLREDREYWSCDKCVNIKMLRTRIKRYNSITLETVFPNIKNWFAKDNKYPLDCYSSSSNMKIHLICPKCNCSFYKKFSNASILRCGVCGFKDIKISYSNNVS